MCGSGCHLTDSSLGTYETIEANPHRDTQLAIRKNERALRLIHHENCVQHDDLAKAEELLQEALVADVTYAPAHTTWGISIFCRESITWRRGNLSMRPS